MILFPLLPPYISKTLSQCVLMIYPRSASGPESTLKISNQLLRFFPSSTLRAARFSGLSPYTRRIVFGSNLLINKNLLSFS